MYRENIEPSDINEKFRDRLSFVELPPLLRQIGDTPPTVIEQGFDPKKSEQIAIFGERNDLEEFLVDFGVDKKDYPIHDAKMGTHIDVYDQKIIFDLKNRLPITSAKNYWKNKKSKLVN